MNVCMSTIHRAALWWEDSETQCAYYGSWYAGDCFDPIEAAGGLCLEQESDDCVTKLCKSRKSSKL